MKITLYARKNGTHERVTEKFKQYVPVEGASYYEIRCRVDGKRAWKNIGKTLEVALGNLVKEEGFEKLRTNGQKMDRVPMTNTGVREAVEVYLEQKKTKRPTSLAQYRNTLNQFADFMAGFQLDQITVDDLRSFKNYLESDGYAPKTIDTRLNIVFFLLKKNGIAARIPNDEMPVVDPQPAKVYKQEELDRLDAVMSNEEYLRYQFFLGSACREQEVEFASWEDINWEDGTYHVSVKPDVGFKPKNHEERYIPLPDDLLVMLRKRHTKPPHARWIFVNEDGEPEGHFLRKFKAVAKRAGLNCGRCKVKIQGREVTCATRPVCEQFYLHRYRKTCATRWAKTLDVHTVQVLLGHKSLATTQRYLGITDGQELRDKINQAAKRRYQPQLVPQRRAAGD